MDGSSYHDEAGGDGVVAAMAQLPKFGPVVLLTEEPSIFFIIPVGQRGAALTTPNRRRDGEKDMRSCPLDQHSTRVQHLNTDKPSETAKSQCSI